MLQALGHFKVMPPHFGGMTLSHLSRQVGLGALVRGVGEHGGGIAILYQFAQVHEHGLGMIFASLVPCCG